MISVPRKKYLELECVSHVVVHLHVCRGVVSMPHPLSLNASRGRDLGEEAPYNAGKFNERREFDSVIRMAIRHASTRRTVTGAKGMKPP